MGSISCSSVIASRNEWSLMSTKHGHIEVDGRQWGEWQHGQNKLLNRPFVLFQDQVMLLYCVHTMNSTKDTLKLLCIYDLIGFTIGCGTWIKLIKLVSHNNLKGGP